MNVFIQEDKSIDSNLRNKSSLSNMFLLFFLAEKKLLVLAKVEVNDISEDKIDFMLFLSYLHI